MKIKNTNKKRPARLSNNYTLMFMTLVCAVLIFFSLSTGLSGGPLQTAAGFVFVPMQKGIYTIGQWVGKSTEAFRTVSSVMEENEALKAQVNELTVQLNTLKLDQYELDTYRDLLELEEYYSGYEKVAANVIGKDAGNWFSTFTIDKGANQGISVGMNVLAGGGLLGIVTDVGPNYAKVRSIIDDSSNISVMASTTRDNFNVTGDLESIEEQKMLPFSGLSDDDDVAIGDPVVTSYISDLYLPGLLVGYVSEISLDPNQLTKSGMITPVVDFEHVTTVLIILDMKNTGDSGLEETVE